MLSTSLRGAGASTSQTWVLLLVPRAVIEAFPGPGGPAADDRERVIVCSGPAKGRPWRRKPRIQVRLGPGHSVALVRSAMALALAISEDVARVRVEDALNGSVKDHAKDKACVRSPAPEGEIAKEHARLHAIVSVLSIDSLPDGVRTRADALHVLGFAPERVTCAEEVRARFRLLATVHHPDGRYGSHARMSQLNAAMGLLRARAT